MFLYVYTVSYNTYYLNKYFDTTKLFLDVLYPRESIYIAVFQIITHAYQYQFLVTMILYVQVTVSQYYLKSVNAVPVILAEIPT